jgi:hypothetical protein
MRLYMEFYCCGEIELSPVFARQGALPGLCDAGPCGNPIEAALLPPLGDHGNFESI